MSRKTKILLIVAALVAGIAIVTIILSNLPNLVPEWVAIEFTLFSNLFNSALNWIGTTIPKLAASTINTAATLLLTLLSPLGIAIPKEVAAGVTFSLIAIIILLFTRSSFTKIAFRNVPRRKLRNGLTVLAIVLGVALVVGVNIAFDSAFIQFRQTLTQATGNVDITIRSGLDVPIDQSLLTTVRAVEGVADASGRIHGQAVVLKSDDDWEAVSITGTNSSSDFDYLDPDSTTITRKVHFMTTQVELAVNSTNAVVDAGLNYSLGDVITVYLITHSDQINPTNEGALSNLTLRNIHFFTVVGVLQPSQVSDQPGIELQEYRIYIDLVKAQSIFDLQDKVSSIIVKVVDVQQTEHVVNDLRDRLGATYLIAPLKQSVLNQMEGGLAGFQYGLQIMSVMGLCVALLIILNTIYMSVSERTYEIGILRSIGTSTRQIFWTFFSESLILGVIGVAVGLVAGSMMAKGFLYVVSLIFSPLTGGTFAATTFEPRTWHYVMGGTAGMVATILAGVFPSLIASRKDVVKALRPAMRKGGKSRTALKLILIGGPLTIIGALSFVWFSYLELSFGIILVNAFIPIMMIGLFLLLAGLLRTACPLIERIISVVSKATSKIISRNIGRNLLRSTISFSLIGMSLSFVILMGGIQAGVSIGVEDMIYSFFPVDLTISSRTMLSRSFVDNLRGIDEGTMINLVTPVCIVPYRTILETGGKNSTSTLWAIEPSTYSKVISMILSEDSPVDVVTKLEEPGTIILAMPLAQSLNASVGEEVKIYAANYTDTTTISTRFTVIGILEGGSYLEMMRVEGTPLSEACYISYQSLSESFPAYTDQANLFFAKAASGQDVGHIQDRVIEDFGDEYLLGIITTKNILAFVETETNRTLAIFYAIIMLAVVNAAVGIAAIMVMNIAERRREIGIVRSQGMSNLQVVVSIIGEVIVLSVVGFLVATFSGLSFLRLAISYMKEAPVYMSPTGVGFAMPYIVPFDAIGLSLLLAVGATLISAAYPAYRASKLNIVEALRRIA